MLTKIQNSVTTKVKESDIFHISPSMQNTKTVPGGVQSILLGTFIWWLWYYHLKIMFNYEDPLISTVESKTNFDKIGTIKMSEMGTSPFYSFYYEGSKMKINSTT